MSLSTPPRLAVWLVGRLLPPAERDALIGDLVEECALRAHPLPRPSDTWWYWSQCSRSVLPLLRAAVVRGRWLGTLAAAVAGYGLVQIVERAGWSAASRWLAPRSLAGGITGLVLTVSAMVLGGYVAARIRSGAAGVVAAFSAISVFQFLLTASYPVPFWYAGTLLLTCTGGALAGGAITRRREA